MEDPQNQDSGIVPRTSDEMDPKAKNTPAKRTNATPSIDLASRIRGSFIGLAVCDALGGPVEFKSRGSYPKHTEMTHNATFNLPAGSWTDDTSTALCLAKSLLEHNGEVDIGDQVQKYIAWWTEGYNSVNGECFDIGNLTRSVLGFWQRQLQKTGYHELKPGSKHARDLITSIQHAVNAGFSVEVGVKSSGEITYHAPRAGNGSLMRIVPVALIAKSDQRALTMARECSRTTHPHVICSDCCEIYVKIVRMALTRSSKEDLAVAMWKYAEDREIDSAITDALRQYKTFKDWTKRPETDIRSEGYVLYGLEIAFWALCCTNTFEEGAIKVINLGYDTDTNGAIYGGLAGAYYGFEAIPKRWLDKLRKKRVLEDTVKAMIAFRTGEDNCEGSPAKKKCV